MFPQGVRSLNSENVGTTDLQWPFVALWRKKKMVCMCALHCEMSRRMIMFHVRRVFYLIFKKPGHKASTVIIYINLFSRMSITQDGNKVSVEVQPADSWRNRLFLTQCWAGSYTESKRKKTKNINFSVRNIIARVKFLPLC
jgi:hypothetical protein